MLLSGRHVLFSQDLGVVIALREQLRMRNVALCHDRVFVRIMNNDNKPPRPHAIFETY